MVTFLRSSLLFALFALILFMSPPATLACSDAGPGNYCNDGGAAWIRCAAHGDCPTGQYCGIFGFCSCSPCAVGDTCDDGGCRCARRAPPTPLPGCTVVGDTCGGDYYMQVCDAGPPPPPTCTADGGPVVSCSSDIDCAGYSYAGVAWVCSRRGVCDCPTGADLDAGTIAPGDAAAMAMDGRTSPPRSSGACSVTGGRPTSWLVALTLVGPALVRRRR